MEPIKTFDGKTLVATCRSAEDLLHDQLHDLDHEEAWVIYLTSRRTVIDKEMVSKGTFDATAIDCRTILRQTLLHNAVSIILLHNHPSGDPKPSRSDIILTDRLRQACSVMDIKLIDHIIVGGDYLYSFNDERTYKIIS